MTDKSVAPLVFRIVIKATPLAIWTALTDPAQGGGGWPWILSDLKSLLETGQRMAS